MSQTPESKSSENKRLLRIVLILAAAAIPIIAGLAWYGLKLNTEAQRRRIVATNEAAAISALDQIAAAQQLYLETYGQYGTFNQLAEAGVFQAPLQGESLVSGGYRFSITVTAPNEGRGPTYAARADPIRSGGDDATGIRHFFAGSEVTGLRYSEGRPATAADRPLPRRADAF
jgi:hypothetical protein